MLEQGELTKPCIPNRHLDDYLAETKQIVAVENLLFLGGGGGGVGGEGTSEKSKLDSQISTRAKESFLGDN